MDRYRKMLVPCILMVMFVIQNTTVHLSDVSSGFAYTDTPAIAQSDFEDSIERDEAIQNIQDYSVNADIFYDDFEGDLSKWDHLEKQNAQGGSIKKDPLDVGNNVFMAYTWRGENPLIRPRSELRVDNYETLGKDYWYSWKFMIDSDKRHNSASEIIGQWHSKPDFQAGETWNDWVDGSFALAIGLEPFTGEIEFSATYMDIIDLKTGIFPERGKWHDIVWHIKHSTEEDGYVEVWIDGKPLLPFNGSDYKMYGKTAYNESGSYLKIGSYRYNYTSWTSPIDLAVGESCIYYDDVVVGSGIYEKKEPTQEDRELNPICWHGLGITAHMSLMLNMYY